MVIALLDNREEYEQWYMQIICSEENTEYPSLLNAHEIETARGKPAFILSLPGIPTEK